MRDLDLVKILVPLMPGTIATAQQLFLWQEDHKEARNKRAHLDNSINKAYSVVYDKCSPCLKTCLEGKNNFKHINPERDVVELLKLIKAIICQFDNQRQGVFSLVQAKKMAMTFYYTPKMTNNEYLENFKALIEFIEAYGGNYGKEDWLVRAQLQVTETVIDPNNPTTDETAAAITVV